MNLLTLRLDLGVSLLQMHTRIFHVKNLLKDALNIIGYEKKMRACGKIYFVCLMYFFVITAS